MILNLLTPAQDSLHFKLSFGDFSDASSISCSRGEFIFIADAGTNKIYKYDTSGILKANYGGTGLGKYELNLPVSLDASNGLNIYVADYNNNRIVRLDYNLNFILLFDFNLYNPTAETSKKIYNPVSLALSNTGDLFVLCDAGSYKAIGIKEFNDVNVFFGKVSDRIVNPLKIVRGNSLDIWILEKSSNELMNFNNLGIFVKELKLPEYITAGNIAYFGKFLLILAKKEIYFYDLVKGKYSKSYFVPVPEEIRDFDMIDNATILILTSKKVYITKITGQ